MWPAREFPLRLTFAMITPAPTSKIAPHLARGLLEHVVVETATKPAYIVFSVPDTSYKIHLRATVPITSAVGKRLVGTVRVKARRLDVVDTGGRYVEPVFGRPRRVQGTVVSTDAAANTVTVNAGVPIACELTDPRQSADQFQPGQLVSADVLDGATFTPST